MGQLCYNKSLGRTRVKVGMHYKIPREVEDVVRKRTHFGTYTRPLQVLNM